MQDISAELAVIRTASRGEEVRDAFIAACGKLAAAGRLPPPTEEGDKLTVDENGIWRGMG